MAIAMPASALATCFCVSEFLPKMSLIRLASRAEFIESWVSGIAVLGTMPWRSMSCPAQWNQPPSENPWATLIATGASASAMRVSSARLPVRQA